MVRLDVAAGADAVVDITDEQAVQVALGRVGPVDILVNSAGIVGPNAPLWEVSTADWERTFAVNVTGAFQVMPRARARNGRSRLGADRQHRVDRRQGRQPRDSAPTRRRKPQ